MRRLGMPLNCGSTSHRVKPKNAMQTLLLLGPDLDAVSGISTHLNQLMGSSVAQRFRMLHFRVGSEGRRETCLGKIWRMLASPWQLLWVLVRERPKIVHINSAMDPKAFWRDLVYLLVAWSMRRRIVYQVHGGLLPEEFTRGSRLFAWILRTIARLPDCFVLIAQIESQAWQRFMPELQTQVIANAIDTGWANAGASSVLPDEGRLRLVYVGRLVEAKGLFEAVHAIARLRREGVSVHMTIAGGGSDEARLKALVVSLDLKREIAFPGPLFGPAKARCWLAADVLVFPTWREGLPYSLLEAMAAGLVPITCAVGAIPDVITDGRDGLLVPVRDPDALAEAIRWVHEHRVAAGSIAQAARRRVIQHYTIERLAGDFCGVYSRL